MVSCLFPFRMTAPYFFKNSAERNDVNRGDVPPRYKLNKRTNDFESPGLDDALILFTVTSVVKIGRKLFFFSNRKPRLLPCTKRIREFKHFVTLAPLLSVTDH